MGTQYVIISLITNYYLPHQKTRKEKKETPHTINILKVFYLMVIVHTSL